MTLAELAALAAKVEGFKRPMVQCPFCDGPPHGECEECDDTGFAGADSSPAALLMAVTLHASVTRKRRGDFALISSSIGVWGSAVHDGTAESIARAALVALLRAHGVGVPDAES